MIGFGYLSYGQAEQIPAAITGGLFLHTGRAAPSRLPRFRAIDTPGDTESP